MKKILLFSTLLLVKTVGVFAQNTLGLLSYDPDKTYEGYNLIFPHNQPNVYLLDNCGQIVHQWTDDAGFRPGNSVYLLENGNLLKCKRPNASVQDPIWAGGGGATVEIRSWENELLHAFHLNNEKFRLHHDVAPLPNGNILMIAWALKTAEEAIQAGRDTSLLPGGELWSEVILEWNPQLDSIVWEWHVWDHLVQEYDATKDNFGIAADQPGKIDINYDEHDGHPDWLHINAIDYNPVLDQFVLSVPYFNELWIVDHSTTTAEAAGSTGGKAGQGGDLLYRWGNAVAYGQAGEAEQRNFFQHDTHWPSPEAQPGESGFAELMLYNNRVEEASAPTGLIISPFDTSTWSYTLNTSAYGPSDFTEKRSHPKLPEQAVSSSVSSVQRLPNNNWLVCAGRWGFAYELTAEGEVVWEYIVPVKQGTPAIQGDILSINNNLTFRVKRYGTDYAAFDGRSLVPRGYLEEQPNETFCPTVVAVSEPGFNEAEGVRIYPNPVYTSLVIEKEQSGELELEITDMQGRVVEQLILTSFHNEINTNMLAAGIYIIRCQNQLLKFVKIAAE